MSFFSNSSVPFKDLGKSGRDLFDKGYNFGKVKCDAKLKADGGVTFESKSTFDPEKGDIGLELQSSFNVHKYAKLTETWKSENLLTSELCCEYNGFKFAPKHIFSPATGNNKLNLTSSYKRAGFHGEAASDWDLKTTPPVSLSMTAGVRLADSFPLRGTATFGGQLSVDMASHAVNKHSIAAQVEGNNYVLYTAMTNMQQIDTSVYNRVSDRLELATCVGWAVQGGNTTYGLAAKYKHDDAVTFQSKLAHTGFADFATSFKINKALSCTVSKRVNLKNLNAGGHKVGIGLSYEA